MEENKNNKETGIKYKYAKKFNFQELTSNRNGKTSGSGTAGLFLILIGGFGFVDGVFYSTIMHKADVVNAALTVITQSLIIITVGAALLGYRKSKENVLNDTNIVDDLKGGIDKTVESFKKPKDDENEVK